MTNNGETMMKLGLIIVLAILTVGCGMKSTGVQRDFIYSFCQENTEGVVISTNWGQVWECVKGKWVKKA